MLRAAGSCVRRTAERMHRDVICIIMTLLIMRIIVPLNVAFQCVVLHGPVCCLFFVCHLLKTIANPFEQSMIDFVYKGKYVCTCFPRDMYHMNTDPHRLPQYLKFDCPNERLLWSHRYGASCCRVALRGVGLSAEPADCRDCCPETRRPHFGLSCGTSLLESA